jgi:hypothetical protein
VDLDLELDRTNKFHLSASQKGGLPDGPVFLFMRVRVLSPTIGLQCVARAESKVGSLPQTNNVIAVIPIAGSSGTNLDHEHPEEDFQARIRANAPPATTGSTNREEGFHWDFSWKAWDGLHLSVSRTTHLKSPREMLGLPPLTNAPVFHLDQLKMTANISALFEVDAADYNTTGNLELHNAIGLRRARLTMQGCILVLPVTDPHRDRFLKFAKESKQSFRLRKQRGCARNPDIPLFHGSVAFSFS